MVQDQATRRLPAQSSQRALTGSTLRKLRLGVIEVVLVALCLAMLLPLVLTLVYSVTPESDIFNWPITWIPTHPNWANYVEPFVKEHFQLYFLNSIVVATAQTLGSLLFASMAGYGLAKFSFPGRTLIFVFMLSTLMMPAQVILVPLYVLVRQLGWVNSFQGLIVPGLVDSFGIFLMRQFALSIPDEYLQAARIDGASELTIYRAIVLPMLLPAISALCIFTFTGSWNQFLWPLVVVDKFNLWTVPLGMTQYMDAMVAPRWGELMATSIIALVPILVVFLAAEKQFVQGAAISGLKG